MLMNSCMENLLVVWMWDYIYPDHAWNNACVKTVMRTNSMYAWEPSINVPTCIYIDWTMRAYIWKSETEREREKMPEFLFPTRSHVIYRSAGENKGRRRVWSSSPSWPLTHEPPSVTCRDLICLTSRCYDGGEERRAHVRCPAERTLALNPALMICWGW